MDYKEKYEMALEGIQEILGSGEDSIKMSRLQLRLQGIFPELKESEGKDIKQFLIDFIKVCGWTEKKDQGWPSKEKCIAWLEKQGEQKSFARYKVGDTIYYDSFGRLVSFVIANIVEDGTDNPMYEDKDGNSVFQNDIVEQKPFDYEKAHIQQNDFAPKSAMKAANEEKVDNQNCVKPADKVESKFKAGDWVIDKQGIVHQIANVIENVTNHTYGYDIVGGGYFNDNTEGVRLWTIQDAKDGDVLVLNDEMFIYAHRKQLYSIAVAHCFVDSDGCFHFDGEFGHTEKGNSIYPATKEQRDTLMKAMADDGYTFDFEKKELKKIEQKPAEWSEEDGKMINKLLAVVNLYYDRSGNDLDKQSCISFLKSLKDRVQPQPQQQWSEEDKAILEKCIGAVKVSCYSYSFKSEAENWLKSLRPQSTWKPSDAQMASITCAVRKMKESACYDSELVSLFNDLKKLKG